MSDDFVEADFEHYIVSERIWNGLKLPTKREEGVSKEAREKLNCVIYKTGSKNGTIEYKWKAPNQNPLYQIALEGLKIPGIEDYIAEIVFGYVYESAPSEDDDGAAQASVRVDLTGKDGAPLEYDFDNEPRPLILKKAQDKVLNAIRECVDQEAVVKALHEATPLPTDLIHKIEKYRGGTMVKRKAGASGWIGVAYDGAQVPVDDTRATKWMNTRTYDSTGCKPPQKYLDNSSLRIPSGEDVCKIGARRVRKSRRGRKSRRVTRRKL